MSHRIEHGMVAPAPEHLLQWIQANRADMRPPVSNKYLYDGQDFFAMCIAGPNARNDYHITDSEEFFLQLQGDIVVTLLEEDGPRHVRSRPARRSGRRTTSTRCASRGGSSSSGWRRRGRT